MSSAYRILKLNTGEEIITRIQKRQKGRVYMETPMCFRTVLMSDPMTGVQREITILKDWVGYTTDKFIKIPESMVISYSSPMEEAISLYEKEKEKKAKAKKREIKNLESFQKDMKSDMEKYLNDMLDQMSIEEDEEYPPSLNDIFRKINSINPEETEIELDFEYTFFGEEISDDTTEKEINHPDYGNRWTDWSSDPREY